MTIRYRVTNFKFDMDMFATCLRNIADKDVTEVAAIIGVDASTLRNWRSNAYRARNFVHPSMSNFIKTCNVLDIDPREFFILED